MNPCSRIPAATLEGPTPDSVPPTASALLPLRKSGSLERLLPQACLCWTLTRGSAQRVRMERRVMGEEGVLGREGESGGAFSHLSRPPSSRSRKSELVQVENFSRM